MIDERRDAEFELDRIFPPAEEFFRDLDPLVTRAHLVHIQKGLTYISLSNFERFASQCSSRNDNVSKRKRKINHIVLGFELTTSGTRVSTTRFLPILYLVTSVNQFSAMCTVRGLAYLHVKFDKDKMFYFTNFTLKYVFTGEADWNSSGPATAFLRSKLLIHSQHEIMIHGPGITFLFNSVSD